MHDARVIYSTVDFLIYQKDISLKCIYTEIYTSLSHSLLLSLSLSLFRRCRRFLLRLLCVVARSTVIRNALIYRRSCEQTQTGQNRPSILIYLERAQPIHCKVSIRIYNSTSSGVPVPLLRDGMRVVYTTAAIRSVPDRKYIY